ncbi:MAG: Gas vesicle synthesis protein GvpL/GvpF, partial [Solirubrobacteraceae bacterium]|nr:Gas vesicle synthesis protein GvpL/GvpF [Solirubrobacteraceae bacterium]
MIYVYAITEAPAAVPDELDTLASGPLAAVVRTVAAAPAATPEEMLAHESRVEAVMAAQPVLPVRFGTTFDDAAEIVSLLERNETEFAQRLDEVRGCVELSVRMRWTPEPAS